jgi:hypothetical protein
MKKRKPSLHIYHSRPLTGEHAFMTAELLESIVRMLWRELGDDMADFQGRVFPDDPSCECNCYSRRIRQNDDEHFS